MQKNKLIFGLVAVLAMVSSFNFTNLIQKQDLYSTLTPNIKEAKADHCGDELEITAGQTGSIHVSMHGSFGGVCIPALITNGNGVTFNNVFNESGTCSNGLPFSRYVSSQYNATGVNVTTPTIMTFSVETIQDTGSECTTIQSSVQITVVPAGGGSGQDFSVNCGPASRTITAGTETSYSLSTTPIGTYTNYVAWSGSVSPSNGMAPVLNYTNNNQVPPSVTSALVGTAPTTNPTTYTITFTATSGSVTKQCSVSLIVLPYAPIVGAGATQLAVYQLPTTTFSVNGMSNTNVQVGQSATLQWTPFATNSGNSCTAGNAWTGNKPGTPNTSYTESVGPFAAQGTYTYTLQCTGALSSVSPTMSVQVTVGPATPPTYSIMCSPTTMTIEPGGTAAYVISVEALNGYNQPIHVDASISPNPKGAPEVSFVNNDEIPPTSITSLITTDGGTPEDRYIITYTVTGGGLEPKTCDVELIIAAVPMPEPPLSVTASNDDNCGTITIQWIRNPDGTVPEGFRVMRRTLPSDPWQQVGGDIPYNGEPANHIFSFDDTNPLNSNGSNFYSVVAYAAGVESVPGLANPAPIVPRPCAPNVSTSDKDIISVSGRINRTFTPLQCSNASEPAVLPNKALFAPGDVITFQINVCNTGDAVADDISVTDTYTNLSNIAVLPSDPASCVSSSSINGSSVVFTITKLGISSVCAIRITGVVTSPPNPTAAIYRFQNRGLIEYIYGFDTYTKNVFTPPYLFSVTGGVPDRNETAPQQQ